MAIPVIKVTGIGPKSAEFLEANGISTAEALLKAGLDKLCEAPGFHANRAQAALDAAREMTGTTVSAETGKAEQKPKATQKDKKKGKTSKGKKKDKKTNKPAKDKKAKKPKKENKKKPGKKGKGKKKK